MEVDDEGLDEATDIVFKKESQVRMVRLFNVNTFTAGMGISCSTNLRDPDAPREGPDLSDFEALIPFRSEIFLSDFLEEELYEG